MGEVLEANVLNWATICLCGAEACRTLKVDADALSGDDEDARLAATTGSAIL
jgi:hypothetical protein